MVGLMNTIVTIVAKNFMKNIFRQIIFIILILIITVVLFYFYQSSVPNQETEMVVLSVSTTTPDAVAANQNIMTDSEKAAFNLPNIGIFEVTSRDASGKITDFKLIGMTPPKVIDNPEFMTDEEKKLYGLSDFKVQVLRRNAEGKITAYHIVKNETDIVTAY